MLAPGSGISSLFFLPLLLLKVTKLHFEGSQLVCEEGCHLAEPLLELHCHVEGWNQAGSVVSCFSLVSFDHRFNWFTC